ncbi:hypothetical protein [Paraburkholderia terricola]|uniref:hypothetical protein n=1 Tax=Paraburkholderia terricola TaxID=169427 RepID=UPI001ABF228E|nr:hypothetical protein [Paraburkholderia terricola]
MICSLKKARDQRLQSLAANPVGCFPQHRQRLAYRLVVQPVALARPLCRAELFPQQPNGVFAVIPGQSHELIENADPFTERRDAIPQLQLLPSTPCVSSC